MGLSNAEPQRRYRDRRTEQQPRVDHTAGRRTAGAGRRDTAQALVYLQAEYQDRLYNLLDCLQAPAVAQKYDCHSMTGEC